MMSTSLHMSIETVAFQTTLAYLVTLRKPLANQQQQDADPGETAYAHGAELGEHTEE